MNPSKGDIATWTSATTDESKNPNGIEEEKDVSPWFFKTEVVTGLPGDSIVDAARKMRENRVGAGRDLRAFGGSWQEDRRGSDESPDHDGFETHRSF